LSTVLNKKEGAMEGMKLCWKCRDWLNNVHGYTDMNVLDPVRHCHHPEPEEKPKEKCWCDKLGFEFKLSTHRRVEIEGLSVEISFCPQCGKKL
jgi:hypothetical protein